MRKVFGVLAAVCWLVFGITGVIRWIAGDGGLMAAEMLRNAPPEETGLPEKDYPGVGTMTAEYLTGHREAFQYVVAQGTPDSAACARTEVFQPHEAAHMADCRGLIRLDTWVCVGSGLAALALTAAGWIRKTERRSFLRGILWGLGGFAGVCAGMLIWALADFDGLFVTFHRVAFPQGGWILDARTDLLIRLMPTEFFVRLGIHGLLRFAMIPVVMAAAAGCALRGGMKQSDSV